MHLFLCVRVFESVSESVCVGDKCVLQSMRDDDFWRGICSCKRQDLRGRWKAKSNKNLDDQGINLNFSTGVDRFAIWYHSIQELL